ncbi:hypothetical protein QY95_00935 [Bacillus thermotolerans]|uniref:Uncharacterized protein n=1 Tax=Bacillus thermotolerans TaxID=1221996 RepID=A0A0F5I706_BACTR|nr:hypothetical protein QY95_00935 [Bacillus thermotolerans]
MPNTVKYSRGVFSKTAVIPPLKFSAEKARMMIPAIRMML